MVKLLLIRLLLILLKGKQGKILYWSL